MSLVTPLNRVLGLGSAKEGAEHWWAQRLSAVALALLGIWLTVAVLGFESFDYAFVVDWIRAPVNSILLVLTVIALGYHSQLGVQVVVEDYVHGTGLKIATLILSTFVHLLLVVAGLFSVLKLAFGAAA